MFIVAKKLMVTWLNVSEMHCLVDEEYEEEHNENDEHEKHDEEINEPGVQKPKGQLYIP